MIARPIQASVHRPGSFPRGARAAAKYISRGMTRGMTRGMNRGIALALSLWLGVGASAAESDWPMVSMEPDLRDAPSLQRGAKYYVNYCLGCHSLKFQRYERTAVDLGVPEELFLENLIFTGQKIGGLMATSMPLEESKAWFGAAPPDLTMVARVRGVDWLYNYLLTFYVDEERPFGVNNKVFPNVGMPNVLMELQGTQTESACGPEPVDLLEGENAVLKGFLALRSEDSLTREGEIMRRVRCDTLVVEAGTGLLGEDEFEQAVYDIVNFLYYVGEPTRLERERLGVYVLLFLGILFVFAYLLNREYWKDIH